MGFILPKAFLFDVDMNGWNVWWVRIAREQDKARYCNLHVVAYLTNPKILWRTNCGFKDVKKKKGLLHKLWITKRIEFFAEKTNRRFVNTSVKNSFSRERIILTLAMDFENNYKPKFEA